MLVSTYTMCMKSTNWQRHFMCSLTRSPPSTYHTAVSLQMSTSYREGGWPPEHPLQSWMAPVGLRWRYRWRTFQDRCCIFRATTSKLLELQDFKSKCGNPEFSTWQSWSTWVLAEHWRNMIERINCMNLNYLDAVYWRIWFESEFTDVNDQVLI